MYLKTLKLNRMEKALDQELARAAKESLSPSEVLEDLLAIEANALIERRVERRIKESKLPERKLLGDFDFASVLQFLDELQKGVDKGQIMEL
jgi:DNA replication protein DnaC